MVIVYEMKIDDERKKSLFCLFIYKALLYLKADRECNTLNDYKVACFRGIHCVSKTSA